MDDLAQELAASPEVLPADAFAQIQSEMGSLAVEDLLPLNLDPWSVVKTTLGVGPQLKLLRPHILSTLPAVDLALIDRLPTYAAALMHAQAQFLATSKFPDDHLHELIEHGQRLRETLTKDVAALAQRGYLNRNVLAQLKANKSFNALCSDLLLLADVLQSNWATLRGKCAIEEHEPAHASQVSTHISRLLGRRQHVRAELKAAVEQRLRVFTLLMRAYDSARDASIYLNSRDPQVPALPSLYRRRKRHKAQHHAAAAVEPVAPGPYE